MGHVTSALGRLHHPAIGLLDQLVTTLTASASTTTFWPFIEAVGTVVHSYGESVNILSLTPADEAAAINLETEFIPYKHAASAFSYYVDGTTNNHLRGTNNAAYTFGNAAADTPFSLGIWVNPRVYTVTARSLMAVYDATGLAREWDFRITTAGKLEFELYDESVDTTEIGTGTAAITLNKWSFVVMSYDGNEVSPTAQFYINGATDGNGSTTETGAYVAMEDTATPLLIGARGTTAAPAQEVESRLALPFIVGKALTAGEVTVLYRLGQRLLDIT